jgi:hypothetical protein
MTSSNVKPVDGGKALLRRGLQTNLPSSQAIGIVAGSADRPASRQSQQYRICARFRVDLRFEQGALSND